MIDSNSLWRYVLENKGTRAYILILCLFWSLGAIFLALKGYEESFLIINRTRFALADLIAPHLTHLGDGLLLIGLIGLALTPGKAHWNWAMLVELLAILGAILLCKNVIFEDWNRPLIVFSDHTEFFYNSLSILKRHAFPSGHGAGIAGGMALWVLALRPRKITTGVLMALGTILVAMTRVYIGVHFFGDVVAGTILGSLIAFFIGGMTGIRLDRIVQKDPNKWGLWLQVSGSLLAVMSLFVGFALLIARYY